MLLEYCDAKHLSIANIRSRKADMKKITNGSGYNESEIDFCIMEKVDRKFFLDVEVITGEMQHNPVTFDADRKKKKENRVAK